MNQISFYPSLNSLKQKLCIPKINTGKQFNYRGIVFDDVEELHALVGLSGCVHFRTGTEMSTIHYRGQTEDFGSCMTTLDRCDTKEEQILEICRTIAFEELLENHPFVQITKKSDFLGSPICVDTAGIAQHYGLHTNYLDTTSNFDVAVFFATCKWDQKTKQFMPMGNVSKPGILYKIYEFAIPPFALDTTSESEFCYIGWQPLPRPEQQRANVIKLAKNKNFDDISGVKKYYFKHSISTSKKIYKMFEGGKILFPKDSASEMADICKNLLRFTTKQLEKAIRRYEKWSNKLFEESKKDEFIAKIKIEIVQENNLQWNNVMEIDSSYWEAKLEESMKKVRYRMTASHFDEK